MSSKQRPGSRILGELSRAVDALVLGMMWLVCSLPIITIGASSAAFYYAYHEVVRLESGHVWQAFWTAFRSNFKKATKSWLVVLAIVIFAIVDYGIVGGMSGEAMFHGILLVSIAVILVITLAWALYLFPCIARFDMELGTIMKNCAIIAFANLQWTLLLILIFGVAVGIPMLAPGFSLFTPTAYMFLANRILERVFRKYMTPEDRKAQEELTR